MHRYLALVALAAVTACRHMPSGYANSAPAEARPGLGTSFGETRSSRVREVPFARESESPFAQAAVFYDDREGVRAMAGRDDLFGTSAEIPVHPDVQALIVDEWGRALETLTASGRLYVVGTAGQRYGLRVTNHSARTIEVVASVDGLDVIDGAAASLHKRGYLVAPYATLTIDGFRRNLAQVAAFRFGAVADSYAARTGDDRNVGVIGLALFEEQGARLLDQERADEAGQRRFAEPFTDARFARPPPSTLR